MKEYFVWLAKLLTIFALVFIVIPLVAGMASMLIGGVFAGKDKLANIGKSDKVIAVVEMLGEITDTKELIKELRKQVANDSVKGIVLRVDSPGGAVAPSQDVYDTVKQLKAVKPIVASYGSVAASGGLYSSLSASKIIAQPGTLTGSIGVIMQVPNFSQIANKVGFEMVTVKSGKLKDVGNPFRSITDDERAFLDTTVQSIYGEFIKAVSESRNIPVEKVKEFADGRVITGVQAKELGIIDGFGDIYVAAREVFNVLGKPLKDSEQPELFYPEEDDMFKDLKELKKLIGESITRLTASSDGTVKVFFK